MKYSHDSVRSKSCQIFNHLLQRLNDSYQGGVGEGGGVGGGGDGGGGDGESGVEDADASRQRGDDVTVAKGDSVVSLDVAVARGSLQKRSSDLSRGGLKKRKLDKEEEEEEADEGLFGFKPKLKYFKEDFVQKVYLVKFSKIKYSTTITNVFIHWRVHVHAHIHRYMSWWVSCASNSLPLSSLPLLLLRLVVMMGGRRRG